MGTPSPNRWCGMSCLNNEKSAAKDATFSKAPSRRGLPTYVGWGRTRKATTFDTCNVTPTPSTANAVPLPQGGRLIYRFRTCRQTNTAQSTKPKHQIDAASPHRTIGNPKTSNRQRIPLTAQSRGGAFCPETLPLTLRKHPDAHLRTSVSLFSGCSAAGVFQGACPLNAFFVSFLCKQKRKHRVQEIKFIRNRVVRTH